MSAGASSSAGLGGGRRCRLCWGSEEDEGNPLIQPCGCKGSMQWIHSACLAHWLDVVRAQGRARSQVVRCDICRRPYDRTWLRAELGGGPRRFWRDPYALAGLLHAAWRAYVAVSGITQAFLIYQSIGSPGSWPQQHQRLAPRAAGAPAGGPAAARGPGSRRARQQQQRRARQALADPAGVPSGAGLLPHLSLSLPLGHSGGAGAGSASRRSGCGLQSQQEVLESIRERFDKATLVQVYWYSGLVALMPTPPNADAFAGMTLGASIGGLVAELIFLPLLGSGRLAALGHSCRLSLRCLLRLLAGEACTQSGYRLLARALRLLGLGVGGGAARQRLRRALARWLLRGGRVQGQPQLPALPEQPAAAAPAAQVLPEAPAAARVWA